ncbi:MAG: phosphoenolpyruvate--protein phosphotransferase [Chitinivibrionales bacterium]|nr:phosphoenolpyruvate--protein phosphotransferase [Chitinivibrionales bacterium]
MNQMQLLCDVSELNWIFNDSKSINSFLEHIVELATRHLRAEVCSIYLYEDESRQLRLAATKGLNPKLCGTVTLKLGEGLTGQACKELRPIRTSAASKHPNYKFFKGLAEEPFDAFLAVPILRGIHRIGVLVVQRNTKQPFVNEDITVLQAVASQLANIIENARLLISAGTISRAHVEPLKDGYPPFVKGRSGSEGIASGKVVVLDLNRSLQELATRPYAGIYTLKELDAAIETTMHQLSELQERVGEKLSDAASLIFAAHLMILKDDEFVGKIRASVESGQNAPNAVLQVGMQFISAFLGAQSAYLQEKADDLRDLVIRIVNNLLSAKEHVNEVTGRIVIARDLLPSDVLKMSVEGVSGIVMLEGGVTSHLSILVRALEIPMVFVDAHWLLKLPATTSLLLDADQGNIYINPDSNVRESFRKTGLSQKTASPATARATPTATSDGIRINLLANINLLSDLKATAHIPCDGIGLYRTEFPFLIRASFPSEEEQVLVYRKLVAGSPAGKQITFRTLDIGGDKVLSYYEDFKEKNPFLGLRSIRFSRHRSDIFRQQIRAILRAACNTDLRIMFPMISSQEELLWAKTTVAECIDELVKDGYEAHVQPSIGIMIELPSIVEIIDECASLVDFFSIGSNDLIQYMLAVDRTNEKVAGMYIPHHPAILRALNRIAVCAHKSGIDVSVCGEMAHSRKHIPFLLGIGIRSLSVEPLFASATHQCIARISLAGAHKLAESLLSKAGIAGIEHELEAFDATCN